MPSPAGVDLSQVDALVMTVTGTAASQSGWIQAFPTDRPGVIGGTSTVNLVPGTSVANTAIIPVGTSGVSVAGFKMTQLPATRAAVTWHIKIASGIFQGLFHANTPRPRRLRLLSSPVGPGITIGKPDKKMGQRGTRDSGLK